MDRTWESERTASPGTVERKPTQTLRERFGRGAGTALVLAMAIGLGAPGVSTAMPRTPYADSDFFADDDLGGLDDFDAPASGSPGTRREELPGGGDEDEDEFGFGEPGDDDPFGEPFPESVPTVATGPVAGSGLGSEEYLTAFADLLDELESRGVEVPFHGLQRARLARLTGGGLRTEVLLQVAADPRARVPGDELARVHASRVGGGSVPVPAAPAAPEPPGKPSSEDCWDVDPFDAPEECLEFDPGGFDEPSPPAAVPGTARGPAAPFAILARRRDLARRILAPLTAGELAAWLSGSAEERKAAEDGLHELAGTELGRRRLGEAIGMGIPDPAAEAVARALGEDGTAEDLPLLERIAREHLGASEEAARAEGRIRERAARTVGLDRYQRLELARLQLASAARLAEEKQWRAAARAAAGAAEAGGKAVGPRLALARYAYQTGAYQKAREALERAFADGGTGYELYTWYALVLRRQGEDERLRGFLERAFLQGGPTELKVRLANELALEYTLRGDGAEAERLARIGLGYSVPEEVADNLWTRLAEARVLQGRLEEAETAYRRALALDPGYRKAQTGLAVVRDLRGGGLSAGLAGR